VKIKLCRDLWDHLGLPENQLIVTACFYLGLGLVETKTIVDRDHAHQRRVIDLAERMGLSHTDSVVLEPKDADL